MKATDSGIKEASAAADMKGQMELRVKVAELLGVKCARCKGLGEYLRFGVHEWFRRGNGGEQPPVKCDHVSYDHFRPYQTLPDYPNDLNACHEFEETLKDDCDLWMKYMALLVGKPWHFAWEADEVWGAVNASAEQRCRAFVKTMEAKK